MNLIYTSEINCIVDYKEYISLSSFFGTIDSEIRDPHGGSKLKGLGESRAGKPANSPVGAISRRRGP
jgi:hypothetical protein